MDGCRRNAGPGHGLGSGCYHHCVDAYPDRPRAGMWAWIVLMVGWVLPLYAAGDDLGSGLRRLAAQLSWSIVNLTGLPTKLQDVTLHLPNHYIDITPVCDGVYTLYFLVTLCLFLAGVFELNGRIRVLFIAVSVASVMA